MPLDKEAILGSVAKTGRLVVVDMAHKTCSAASEIAAIVAMEGFWDLQAPIQRLGTINVHIPFSPALEPLCYPTDESIAEAVRVTMSVRCRAQCLNQDFQDGRIDRMYFPHPDNPQLL